MSDTTDRATGHAEHCPGIAGDILGHEDPISTRELLALQEHPEGDVTALYSPAGVFTYVSAASRATLGWEPEELIGRMAEQYIHPEDLPAVLTCQCTALRSSTAVTAT